MLCQNLKIDLQNCRESSQGQNRMVFRITCVGILGGGGIGIMIGRKMMILWLLLIKIAGEDETIKRDNDRDDEKVDDLKGF